MATILRVRWTISLPAGGTGLLQTYWRPGTSGGSTADATDCVARVRTMLVAAQAIYTGGTVYIPQLGVDALEDSTGTLTGSFLASSVANVQGTGTGDSLSQSQAYLVRHNTNLIVAGRRLRGRTYFGVPKESDTDTAGRPASAAVTIVQNAFNGLLTGGSTLSFPVIWSRPTTTPSVRAGTSGPVVASSVESNYFGVQRDRRVT